ncbi:hypothetical protein D9613_009236 [Agrocybe pediades]|uniref:Uncharacterized protein n=1 Tax=Agrocybe pediades TaxID=84607 RepID=A0A8H4VW64_9AGAR|nr:hypothetical protein D9613_009236 [Agrocybe pediades]
MESLQSKHKAEVHCHYTKPVSGNVSVSSNCQDNSPHRDTSEPISSSTTRRSLPSKPQPPSIKRVPSQTGLNMMPRPELPMPIVTDPRVQWLPPTTTTTNTLPYKFPPSSTTPAYAAFSGSPPMLGTGAVSQLGMQAANFANTIAQITEQNVIGRFQMHYAHAQSQWELAERKCKDLEKRVSTLQRAKAEEKGRLEKEIIELRKRLALALAPGHAESSDSPGSSTSTQQPSLGDSSGPPEPGSSSKQWRSEVEEILMLKQTISKLEHSHAATIAQQRSNLRAARKVVEDRLHHAEQRIIELEASLAEAQGSHTVMGDEQLSGDTVQINSPVKQEEGVASVPPVATAENRQMSRILQAAQKQKDELRAMLTQEQEKSATERTRLLHLIEELREQNAKLQETVRQNQARSEIALEISHERLERMKEEKSLCEAALREEKASRASLEQTLTTLLHGLENNVCLKRKADSDTETEPDESQDGGCVSEKKRQLDMRDVKRARTEPT